MLAPIQRVGLLMLATWGASLCLTGAAFAAEATPAATLEPIVVGAPERIEVSPASFELATPQREMRLLVTGFYADGSVQDLTRVATLEPAEAAIARVEAGVARPAANGATEIVVRAGGQEVRVPAVVSGQEHSEPTSFQYGALVALSKQGCNSGACHGSPSGKGGFRLSLRAYDPVLDAETLVREAFQRRTNPLEPEQSLLLQKPTMRVAHGGGRKLHETDAAYAILRKWIAEGCRLDAADAARCVKLDVFPRERILKRPAHTQQLLVLAHFSDGSVRDVTRLSSFSTSDEMVARVDDGGLVVGAERGEAAILVRYLDRIESSSLMFLRDIEGFAWKNPPENNYVDTHVFAKLRQLQIPPSELCSDEEFLRRVYLDVIGVLPTVAEARAFSSDSDPSKRAKLIDALLVRPEYAEYWGLLWADLLRLRGTKVSAAGVPKFHRWIVAALRDNMPYDQFARTLLTAEGSTFSNPPANYYRAAADTNDCTETTSQLFLGIRIQCAKCHNHPFERWTQDNYYGIGAFFNRVAKKPGGTTDEQIVWVARAGEVTQPRTGQQMKPWLPLAGDAEIPAEADRRDAFVAWLTNPENPFFAKVEVNRLWGRLLGRGIVEPVDDFRDSNPPASKELLQALADDFETSGYDRRHIMSTILNSRTYQLSARAEELNRGDVRYFSHARTRLLSAEQLLDAICQVTSVPEKFAGLPLGTRAAQVPSPDAENSFLKVFGQPARETACQCERSSDSNLSQALQMINGPLVHGKIRAETNRFRALTAQGRLPTEIVEELYLAALSRRPSDTELQTSLAHVSAASEPLVGLEDVCWALLNANEFLFQH